MSVNGPYNRKALEKWMCSLKETQDSIQSLSAWCILNKNHHKEIIETWLRLLKKGKIQQRLRLFYLANDIIQVSKRKCGRLFADNWMKALLEATSLVRDERIKHNIQRIFRVWDQRLVFDESFIKRLFNLLEQEIPDNKKQSNIVFEPNQLVQQILYCLEAEHHTDEALHQINKCTFDFDYLTKFQKNIRDYRQGDPLVYDFEQSVSYMEIYAKALEKEVDVRSTLVDLLESSQIFYGEQRGEVKVVTNAYRSFGGRVKTLRRRLEVLIQELPDSSPIPSPDINAPSPTPEDEIELPDENFNNLISPLPSNPSQQFKAINSMQPESLDHIPLPDTPLPAPPTIRGIEDLFKTIGAPLQLEPETVPQQSSVELPWNRRSPVDTSWFASQDKDDRPTLLPSRIPTWNEEHETPQSPPEHERGHPISSPPVPDWISHSDIDQRTWMNGNFSANESGLADMDTSREEEECQLSASVPPPLLLSPAFIDTSKPPPPVWKKSQTNVIMPPLPSSYGHYGMNSQFDKSNSPSSVISTGNAKIYPVYSLSEAKLTEKQVSKNESWKLADSKSDMNVPHCNPKQLHYTRRASNSFNYMFTSNNIYPGSNRTNYS